MSEERFIIQSVAMEDGGDDTAVEARGRYKGVFPGRSARRMTHLGMMIGACLQKLNARQEVPVIYASQFGESASLEKFIASFPSASPALFQSSIHPSAVEQALIPGKRAVDRFYPITSERNLFGKALENCFLLGGSEALLLGGEEKGTWLCPYGLASTGSYAFGMQLVRPGEDEGVGTISIDRSEAPRMEGDLEFAKVVKAVVERESIRVPSFALDAWIQLEWT